MTEYEVEKEIQARLEFKINELLTGIKNRVAIKYSQAWDMTRESEYAWKAFEEIGAMATKELKMATPYPDMDRRRKWQAKQVAVDNLIKSLDLRGRPDWDRKVRIIASEIEQAQNY